MNFFILSNTISPTTRNQELDYLPRPFPRSTPPTAKVSSPTRTYHYPRTPDTLSPSSDSFVDVNEGTTNPRYTIPSPRRTPRSSPTMPSIVRQVDFAPAPVLSREAYDDESYVMHSYARHATHCTQCAHPYESHLQGLSLCEKGHRYALNIVQYVYFKGGKAYSTVDRHQQHRIQVEIPVGCDIVRDLLLAIERGLKLRSKPVISYDRTYPVKERRPASEPDLEPEYEIVEPARSGRERRRGSVYLTSRGSLFQTDLADRRERSRESPKVRVRNVRQYIL